MQWIKVVVEDKEKLINMDQYKWLDPVEKGRNQCVLTHNDGSTITIDATFDEAVIFFSAILYKQDLLGNPL